jgi:hypothetical protein
LDVDPRTPELVRATNKDPDEVDRLHMGAHEQPPVIDSGKPHLQRHIGIADQFVVSGHSPSESADTGPP